MKSQELNTYAWDKKVSSENIVDREINLLSLDGPNLRDFKVLRQDQIKEGQVEYRCIGNNGKYQLSSITEYKKSTNSILCAFSQVILSNFLNKEKAPDEILCSKNILLGNEINLARVYKRKLTQGLQSDHMKKILVQFLQLLNYVPNNSTIQQQLLKYPIILQIMITTFRCYLFKKQKCDSLFFNSQLSYKETIEFLTKQFHLSYVKQDNFYLFPAHNLVIVQQQPGWFFFGKVVELPGKCMELNMDFLGKNYEKGYENPKKNYKHKQHIADSQQSKISKRKAYGKQLLLDNVKPSSKTSKQTKQTKQPLTPIIKGQKKFRISFGNDDDEVVDYTHQQTNITDSDKVQKKKMSKTSSLFSDQFKTVQSQDQQEHKKQSVKADGGVTARFSIQEDKQVDQKQQKNYISSRNAKINTLEFKKHLNKIFHKNSVQAHQRLSLSSKNNTKFLKQISKPKTPTLTGRKSSVVSSNRPFVPKIHKKFSFNHEKVTKKWISQDVQIPEQILQQAQTSQLEIMNTPQRKSSSQYQQNILQC